MLLCCVCSRRIIPPFLLFLRFLQIQNSNFINMDMYLNTFIQSNKIKYMYSNVLCCVKLCQFVKLRLFLFMKLILVAIFIITIITLTALTFRGGCLWVAVAEASGEMNKNPLSLLGLSH